jgi:hypothetical protein
MIPTHPDLNLDLKASVFMLASNVSMKIFDMFPYCSGGATPV